MSDAGYQGVILDTHIYEMFSVAVSSSSLSLIAPSDP